MEEENKKNDDLEATTVTIEAPSDEAITPKKSKKSKRPPPDPTDPAVIAEKAAAHTAEAAAEAAAIKAAEEDNKPSKIEECKYYTSLTLGTLCIVSVFAFLFLVPFVLDPAISTLTHDFVDEPVTCKVTTVDVGHGKSNCTWSSCREGCTADMYHCYQVRVIYSHSKFVEGKSAASIYDWVDLERYDTIENKTMYDTPLLVNIKGCGYPPEISCAKFASDYETVMEKNETFKCFYSRVNPWIVLEVYEPKEMTAKIIASVAIPNIIFLISLMVLLYWYCPYCQARFKKYDEQIDHEGNEEEDEEIDMEDEEGAQDRF